MAKIRNSRNKTKRSSGTEGERILVTIGISRYAELDPLQGPSADVTAFREVMEQQYGFWTMADLRDEEAFGSRILDTLQACGGLEEDDTLVLYYAGHGRSSEFYGMNYWLPYDAEENEIRSWIPSSMISGALGKIPPRHILLLNDSCFSGDLLKVRRNFRERKPGYEETAKRYRAREVLTSGMSEPVIDAELDGHSPFAYHLLDALKNTGESWIDARGLYEYVKRGVEGQTPLYGTLRGHQDGGACLLYRKKTAAQAKAPRSGGRKSSGKAGAEGTEKAASKLAEPAARVFKCPICGLRNREEETFECKVCGRDYLCRDHFDKEMLCCKECAEEQQEAAKKEAEAKRKAEEKRKAEAKRKKEREQQEKAKREEEQRQAAIKKMETGLVQMTYVEGGSFQMGSDDGDAESDEQPVHQVQVDSFFMGIYPVTQKQYQKVMGKNPSRFDSERDSARRPVENVSWYDAVAFCNAMSRREGREEVYTINGERVSCDWKRNGYRLPTEAEWEYAARGGAKSRGYRYAGSNTVGDVARYKSNSRGRTHPVGEKRSNELGLHDMSGNVFEWCWDWFNGEYYEKSPKVNPKGPASGSDRVRRGGSWNDSARSVRSANRYYNTPSLRSNRSGFRVLVPAV